jgi:hypothetical protein
MQVTVTVMTELEQRLSATVSPEAMQVVNRRDEHKPYTTDATCSSAATALNDATDATPGTYSGILASLHALGQMTPGQRLFELTLAAFGQRLHHANTAVSYMLAAEH